LRRAIRESRADVVISFMDIVNILTLLATRGLQVPVIISERIDPSFYDIGPIWNGLRRLVYRSADFLVCETTATLTKFQKMTGARGRVISNIISVPSPGAVAGSQTTAFLPRTLAAMGRLAPQKGFDLLLDAFARIAERNPEWSLKILGEGPLRRQLETQVSSLKLAERVQFLGEVVNPFPILRAADLFVFSSRFEGFGLALAEAMACGLPVVSFDCPSGPRDIVRDGIDGILVPPEDVAALAVTLDRLMRNPEERSRLAARAPEITARFSQERILSLWEQLFDELHLPA